MERLIKTNSFQFPTILRILLLLSLESLFDKLLRTECTCACATCYPLKEPP